MTTENIEKAIALLEGLRTRTSNPLKNYPARPSLHFKKVEAEGAYVWF